MVEALSFQKTLKYWWPLTYIQGHVIQDGRQIHFSKSNLGLKLPITQSILVKFNNFCFVLLLETSSPLWMEKQYQQWFHVSFGSRETTLVYYSSLLWKIALLTGSRHFQLRMMGKLIQTVTVPPLISLQWHINAFRKVLLRAAHSVLVK